MGAGDSSVVILGAPYVFARQKLRKPKHTEAVTMVMRPVLCHNACGLYYTAKDDESMLPGDVCPDCSAPPKPWSIGQAEEVEVAVHMAFGNLVDVAFLRALGPLSRRQIVMPVVNSPPTMLSTGIVRPSLRR